MGQKSRFSSKVITLSAGVVYHADGRRSESCLWRQAWTSFLSVDACIGRR